MATCIDGRCDHEGDVVPKEAKENAVHLQLQNDASPSHSFPLTHILSTTLEAGASQQHDAPFGRISAVNEQLANNNQTPLAQSNTRGIGNLDDAINQQLFQSRAYTVNAKNDPHHGLDPTLAYQNASISAVNGAESSDDSETSNEYALIAQAQNLDGGVGDCLALADTGSPSDFALRSALDKMGRVKEIPIPERKLKAYVNPLDKNVTTVPKYYVLLPLYNSRIGLCEEVKLKVLELSEDTNGFHIILGRRFIRKHGGHRFLAKVEEATFDEPRLADLEANSIGALLESKATKKQRLLDKQNDEKFHEQTRATAAKLYTSSGLGTQSSSTATWGETSGRSQDHLAKCSGSATWSTSAQQPNDRPSGPSYGSPGQQPSPDGDAPLLDLPGEWASRRTNTSSTRYTNTTTNDTIFSMTRRTTASSTSSCSSVPTVETEVGKLAGQTADYGVSQRYTACDVQKQK